MAPITPPQKLSDLIAYAGCVGDDRLAQLLEGAYAEMRARENEYTAAKNEAKAAMDLALKPQHDAQSMAQQRRNVLLHIQIERGRGVPVTWQGVSAALVRAGFKRHVPDWHATPAGKFTTSKRSDYAVWVEFGAHTLPQQTDAAATAIEAAGYSILTRTYDGRHLLVIKLKDGQTLEEVQRRNPDQY